MDMIDRQAVKERLNIRVAANNFDVTASPECSGFNCTWLIEQTTNPSDIPRDQLWTKREILQCTTNELRQKVTNTPSARARWRNYSSGLSKSIASPRGSLRLRARESDCVQLYLRTVTGAVAGAATFCLAVSKHLHDQDHYLYKLFTRRNDGTTNRLSGSIAGSAIDHNGEDTAKQRPATG